MRFGIIGAAGYIAPRHLSAIEAIGGDLVVAHDIGDNVRVLDASFPDAVFFTELDRMERHLAKEATAGRLLDFVSICSPNHLHDGHIRFALRNRADAICEKPIVINPWNLDLLRGLEGDSGRRIWTILQLRLLPAFVGLRDHVASSGASKRFDVTLSYVTSRGRWYFNSWKGREELSGGIVTNIGIHFFDLLEWIFGPVDELSVHVRRPNVVSGSLRLARADVRWFLSVDAEHLPDESRSAGQTVHRTITVDGDSVDFSNYGAEDLHTATYRRIVAGLGAGIEDAAPSIHLTHEVRTTAVTAAVGPVHPFTERLLP